MPERSILNRPMSVSLGWGLFVLCLALQFALFYHRATREVTWAYPAYFDQTSYLYESYLTFDEMRQLGLIGGLRQGLHMPLTEEELGHSLRMTPAQGRLMHLQAALVFLFLGPSRLSALTLNFTYFALLQFLILYTARWLTRRWSLGWVGVGLLLATLSRFQNAGGMLDFRIDFIASCLLGINLCLVIRSGVFRHLGWSVVAGVAAALLIDFRFLTAVLIAPLWIVTLAYLAYGALPSWNSSRVRRLAIHRIKTLLFGGAIAFILTAPVILQAWPAIKRYYWGHVTSGEVTERLREYGVSTLWDLLSYYPSSLLKDHLGRTYLVLGALLAVMAFLAARTFDCVALRLPRPTRRACVFFCLAALFVPLLMLTAWPSRSPVVATLLTMPAVASTLVVIVWLVTRMGPRVHFRWSAAVPVMLASVALATGSFVELNGATKPALPPGALSEYRAVSAFYDETGAYCEKVGLLEPKLVFDRIWDFLSPTILAPLYYERHGVLLKPTAAIGVHIFPVTDQEASEALTDSDIAVLTDPSSPDLPGLMYSYSTSMKARYSMLRSIAEREMVPLQRFHLFSQGLTLYVHPSAHVECTPNDWITSAGTTVRASAEFLRIRPVIELTGRTSLMEFLGDKIGVHAVVMDGSRVLDKFETSFKTQEYYRILLRLNPATLPASGDVQIRLTFDKFVVPKKVGLNEDIRELVLMAPRRVRLLPAGQE